MLIAVFGGLGEQDALGKGNDSRSAQQHTGVQPPDFPLNCTPHLLLLHLLPLSFVYLSPFPPRVLFWLPGKYAGNPPVSQNLP